MNTGQETETVTLELPVVLARRLKDIAAELGGPSAVVERALLMAPVSAKRALMAQPQPGKVIVTSFFSHEEKALIDRQRGPLGMSNGAWVRAVVRARLLRAPQLSADEQRSNSAVRFELLRISDALRAATQEYRTRGGDPSHIETCWREARQVLEGLRAALVGNLLYWSVLDE